MQVNYIRHLRAAIKRLHADPRITPHHIALYIALFTRWNEAHFTRSIPIDREKIMELAKFGSKNTYFKCMAELSFWNYITYFPTRVKHLQSTVVLRRFDTPAGADLEGLPTDAPDDRSSLPESSTTKKTRSKAVSNPVTTVPETEADDDQAVSLPAEFENPDGQIEAPFTETNELITVPVMGHIYKNVSNVTNLSFKTTSHDQAHTNSDFSNDQSTGAASPSEKEKGPGAGGAPAAIPASLAEVRDFFASVQASTHEADRFHHYYQSIGWKIGGSKPIEDWRAAGLLWLSNAPKFAAHKNTAPSPGHLQTPSVTNHAEPF